MQKEFDAWNYQKKAIHKEKPRFYNVREIWWCQIGVNIGSEQDGGGTSFLRPVVILSSFGAGTCLVVPLTTSERTHRYRIPVGIVQGNNAQALLSQIRVVDTRRLVEKMGFLGKEYFKEIRKALKDLL